MAEVAIGVRGAVRRSSDLLLILAAVLTVFITLVVPLPTLIMDLLLVINMAAAFMLLMGVTFLQDPLRLSTFPSLLLVLTFYRLSLNVATTRLILGQASSATDKAGRMIQAFGEIVAGRDEVVGMIIFFILVIIQFVVITRGTTRISEVAARFTLDAMPGKQMSIDADLNAGLITEDEARRRRQRLAHEADFYGAMDGASKWVRGDAIAGLIITLVNIIGGFFIGVVRQGLTPAQSVSTYTRLTVGDGLVSQVPALVISVAAGLMITRSAGEHNLGRQVTDEMLGEWRPLAAAGVVLAVLGLIVFPAVQTLPLAALLVGLAHAIRRQQQRERERALRPAAERPAGPEPVDHLLKVDPVELEIGYSLIPLVDAKQGGELLGRIGAMRKQTAIEMGLVIPPVRIRDNLRLSPNEYVIKIRGEEVARGELQPGRLLAMDTGAARAPLEGAEATKEPAFGTPAYWIDTSARERAAAAGYMVVDATSVVATHLSEILKRNAHLLLTRDETARLLDVLKARSPRLVEEALKVLSISRIQEVLRALLEEGVSIRNLEGILEAVTDIAPRTSDPEILTEYARNALSRTICRAAAPDGKLAVGTVDTAVEDVVRRATERRETGSVLNLSPDDARRLADAFLKAAGELTAKGHMPVFVVSSPVRPVISRFIRSRLPQAVVISYNEIAAEVDIEAAAAVRVEGEELRLKTGG